MHDNKQEGIHPREVDLDIISEKPGDETDPKVKQGADESEVLQDMESEGVNKPLETL